ncbi:soluble lamin-associated protein of 75 kDa isoform X2 [Falco biarmicus]|uniref:soluble lamin-associated protein of 75 kDa isoform X2 n=1 Tax=Falco biarmicus TaxID=345155 RepID=UPI0024BCD7CC|nr:soluble lamin-associated protein of 75 kDa isoform X2 [Falco biarmicus]
MPGAFLLSDLDIEVSREQRRSMSFPVDMLNSSTHKDLEISAEEYLSDLRRQNPHFPKFLSLPRHGKVPIVLSAVGFVPLYGEEQTHKVLALFAPEDLLTAVALYLGNQWWSVDDIVKTSVPAREGLQQVKSLGERIVLYVLNRIIYRTQEMGAAETPFLCHGSNEYAKIMWKNGEAIGFYSVKLTGSVCRSYYQNYKLPVLDTIFVRKKHRGKDSGLIILEDFVDSFSDDCLGLQYPLSSFVYTACKQYLEKYPQDCNLLWEVQGPGLWYQRTSITSIREKENFETAAEASMKQNQSVQAEEYARKTATVSKASGQKTELETQLNADSQKGEESVDVCASTSRDSNKAPGAIWLQSSSLTRPRIAGSSWEPGTSTRVHEKVLHMSKSRSESLSVILEDSTIVEHDEMIAEDEDLAVSEEELHVSPPEKQSEKEETPSEPHNGEVTEEGGKTPLMSEEETANEVLCGEPELQPEGQGEEPLTLCVPLILESEAKPSEDTVSEKVSNATDSEVLAEGGTLVEEEGTEEQQESEKIAVENAAALALKEEPSDNGLPSSMVTEAVDESVSENMLPKTTSSLEDQNEEAGHNSQEAPVGLSQSSLIVVELEGVSFQQLPGQEGPKNQLEEHSEESPEQMDQYTQTTERAADSSSEEAEIEVPIVDRRTLRRKAKGYKGPLKKKGKPA